MTKKAVVLLAPGFEEIEAATPIDVLRRAGVEVTVAGLGTTLVTGAHGLPYQADTEIASLAADEYDMVVLPGGMPGSKNLGESDLVRGLVAAMLAAGKNVAAICAAPALTLAAWGMLDGRRATCYPGMESMFPSTVKFVAESVVEDGNVTTSRGPGTAMAFAFALAAQLAGREKTDDVMKAMLVK